MQSNQQKAKKWYLKKDNPHRNVKKALPLLERNLNRNPPQ